MSKISPFLWYDTQAEEAAKLYTSLFPNSKITAVTYYNADMAKASGQPENSVMTVSFELDGREFTAMNAGPIFKFNESVSFSVMCDSQEEVDKYWNTLTADGGQESQCGWLKDKFGLSWQITPKRLIELISAGGESGKRAANAMLQMKKIEIKKIEEAAEGK
jgi:predicted 3-demethylubiquinone-9 3-methyltransferase (glyoxalase superfamily)